MNGKTCIAWLYWVLLREAEECKLLSKSSRAGNIWIVWNIPEMQELEGLAIALFGVHHISSLLCTLE